MSPRTISQTLLPAFPMALAATPALAQGHGWGYGQHMWGGQGWFLGPLAMIAFLVVVILLVVLLVRWLSGPGDRPGAHLSRESALDTLQQRYARGEIDREEYEERRRVLES